MFKQAAKTIKAMSGINGLEALIFIWEEVKHDPALASNVIELIDWRTTKTPTVEQSNFMNHWWDWINCSKKFQLLRDHLYAIDEKLLAHHTCVNKL